MPMNSPILVVDDDREMLSLLKDFLSRQGYPVSVANSGKNALSFFDTCQMHELPKIILSDVKMSPIDGLELTSFLQNERPNLPVILFSAYANGNLAEAAEKAGAKRFLRKPFGLHQIATMVEEELSRIKAK